MNKDHFRFTRELSTEHECQSWFDHFTEHKMPCAIIKSDNGYAVWRLGSELKGAVDDNHQIVPEVMEGIVVQEYGDFMGKVVIFTNVGATGVIEL